MLCYQQCEVCVFGLPDRILIAVAVDGDDTVGILIDHRTLRVHTEGTDPVAILFCAVNNLAFIKLIRQVGEYLRRQLHPDADIHPVGFGRNGQFLAYPFHPLTAASANGNNTLIARVNGIFTPDPIAVCQDLHGLNMGIEEEFHLILQIGVEIIQNHVVNIRTQMPDGGIQQVQVILDAQGLETAAGSGVKSGALTAEFQVDRIHVVHQLQSLLFADVFIKCTAKIVGNIILPVRKGTCTAKTAHNRTAAAANAAFDPVPINRTVPLAQCMPCLKYSHLQLRLVLYQLISRKNTAGTGSDNDHIIIHRVPPVNNHKLILPRITVS